MEEDKIVPLTRERRTEIEAEITRMSARALRVLAGAYRELQTGKMPDGKREKQVGQLEQNLIFLGLAWIRRGRQQPGQLRHFAGHLCGRS